MKKNNMLLLTVAIVCLFVGANSLFFVQENQYALILQLGEPVGDVRKPGLNVKLPFVQNVVYFDNRILMFTIDKYSSFSSDIKSFDIDNYVCWRITDPLVFVRTLRSETDATERLKAIVFAQLRAAIGGKTLQEVVSDSRNSIMQHVLIESNKRGKEYGVSFVDVRIKRADLPNRQAIFDRMNAERKRMANEYRYGGESMAKEIRSQAELDRDVILAQAQKESLQIRGKAEATAMRIYAEVIAKSPEFYEFTKTLELYGKSLTENTKIILSTNDPILQHFK